MKEILTLKYQRSEWTRINNASKQRSSLGSIVHNFEEIMYNIKGNYYSVENY